MIAKVRTIELRQIDALAQQLLDRAAASGFEAEVAIYLETGARLLAASFHRKTGVPALALTIRRTGSAAKTRAASLLAALPRPIKDLLRRAESRFSASTPHQRRIERATDADLSGKRVLILDDAADSGESLLLAKDWAVGKGASEGNIRLATVCVTQPRAEKIVDFWIYSQICRFPWSSDSQEREQCMRIYAQIDPTTLAAGDLRL